MELLLDLNQKDGIWIDGTHRVFEKSEFEGLGFKVKIKPQLLMSFFTAGRHHQ
jgi:hypothetical protein